MSKTRDIIIAGAVVTAVASAAFATDYTALRNDARIHHELLGASIAYLIDQECPELELRRLKLIGRALSLRSYAKSLGYTGKEVDAYVDDKNEQDRFRAIAEPYLAEQGAVKGDAASYCEVGRAEIEKGTYTGEILRKG